MSDNSIFNVLSKQWKCVSLLSTNYYIHTCYSLLLAANIASSGAIKTDAVGQLCDLSSRNSGEAASVVSSGNDVFTLAASSSEVLLFI